MELPAENVLVRIFDEEAEDLTRVLLAHHLFVLQELGLSNSIQIQYTVKR